MLKTCFIILLCFIFEPFKHRTEFFNINLNKHIMKTVYKYECTRRTNGSSDYVFTMLFNKLERALSQFELDKRISEFDFKLERLSKGHYYNSGFDKEKNWITVSITNDTVY